MFTSSHIAVFSITSVNFTYVVFAALMVGFTACGPSRSESPEYTTARIASENLADTVYVRTVGYVTLKEAYGRLMSNQVNYDEVPRYADAIILSSDTNAVDSLLAYAERYPSRSHRILSDVAQIGNSKLAPWLKTHAEDLDRSDWSNLGAALERGDWRDSTVAAIMLDHVLTAPTTDLSAVAAIAFTGMGTLKDAQTLAQVADTTEDPMLRQVATSTLIRFDVPEFNSRVRNLLPTLETTWTNVVYALRRHNRYDFLPEIRQWVKGFKPGSHGHDELKSLIADLEQEKADDAPLGVPLDYPASTHQDSISP